MDHVDTSIPQCCHLLLTWLHATLLGRTITPGITEPDQREKIVAIFEVAADELRLIQEIGGGDPWIVAEWASAKLAPYDFQALPSSYDELCQALLHPLDPKLAAHHRTSTERCSQPHLE